MTTIAPITPLAPVEQEAFDASLRRRAWRVIPGGMWGHLNAARLPAGYPAVFRPRARAAGSGTSTATNTSTSCAATGRCARLRRPGRGARGRRASAPQADVANGPAACSSSSPSCWSTIVAHADWAMFAKNGTDATTTCVTLARAGTGRRKVLSRAAPIMAPCPGARPRSPASRPRTGRTSCTSTTTTSRAWQAAADEAGDDLAAILVTPFRHDVRRDQELATPEFARAARALCDARVRR